MTSTDASLYLATMLLIVAAAADALTWAVVMWLPEGDE
jgi:hypothetical protein